MSYTVNLTFPSNRPQGGGGVLSESLAVAFTGSIFSPPQATPPPSSGAAIATASATQPVTDPPSLPPLNFASDAVPTIEPSSLLITATHAPLPTGDAVRLMLPDVWPPTLTLLDFDLPLSAAQISDGLAESVPITLDVPSAYRVAAVIAELAAGLPYNDPVSLTLTGMTFATSTPPTAVITATGTLTVRQSSLPFGFLGLFGTITTVQLPARIVITLSVAPSHDATNPSRILSAAGTTVSIAIQGVPSFVVGLIQDFAGGTILNKIEIAVNSTIFALASLTSGPFTPAAVLSAFQAALSATTPAGPLGLLLRLIVASSSPSPVTQALEATVEPSPVADEPRTYVATFRDSSTGAVVPGLEAVISNFTASGAPLPEKATTPTSTGAGTSTFENVTLRVGRPTAIRGTRPPAVITPKPFLAVTDPSGVYTELLKSLL